MVVKAKEVRQALEQKLANPQVQQYLKMLRDTTGSTQLADPYAAIEDSKDRLGTPESFDVEKWPVEKGAGAYHLSEDTFAEAMRSLGLTKFDDKSQDLAALMLLAKSGSLEDVEAGDFASALQKDNQIWEALPGGMQGPKTVDADVAARSLGIELPDRSGSSMPDAPADALRFADMGVIPESPDEAAKLGGVKESGHSEDMQKRIVELMARLPKADSRDLLGEEDNLPTMLDNDLLHLIDTV